ncbi:MAG TPA: flavodoxin domain-containing protein [Thermoanaerobaculia bacterium]
MRILIVYTSRYGQTRKVAERIASVAEGAGVEPHVFEVSEIPKDLVPHSCDVVVLAGSVYFGKHQRALVKFARRHNSSLARVYSVFVSVSGAAGSPDARPVAESDVREFITRTGWTPDRTELVAGGEPYTRYGFFVRMFMVHRWKKLGRVVDPMRDYENTDWSAVERFAGEIVGQPGAKPALLSEWPAAIY